jgi:hypothetical protein
MKPIKWRRAVPRLYTFVDQGAYIQALLFGAPGARQLWAWKVWWKSGSIGRVEHGFRKAKTAAERTIRQILSGEVSV